MSDSEQNFEENISEQQEESESEMIMEEDLGSILQTFFMEDKKDRNVVDVMLEIRRSLDAHNKIMLKILEYVDKYFKSKA
jgi:hypothetical protein